MSTVQPVIPNTAHNTTKVRVKRIASSPYLDQAKTSRLDTAMADALQEEVRPSAPKRRDKEVSAKCAPFGEMAPLAQSRPHFLGGRIEVRDLSAWHWG
jgi:hypothetical protein